MPGFDGTGPDGRGPMTEHRMGRCNEGRKCGRFGRCPMLRGRRFAQGFANFNFHQNHQDDIETLKTYKKELEKEIASVEEELKNSKK